MPLRFSRAFVVLFALLSPAFAPAAVCTDFVQSKLKEFGSASIAEIGYKTYSGKSDFHTATVTVGPSTAPGAEYFVTTVIDQWVSRGADGASAGSQFKLIHVATTYQMNGCQALRANHTFSGKEDGTASFSLTAQECRNFLANSGAQKKLEDYFLIMGLFYTDAYRTVRKFFSASNSDPSARELRLAAQACLAERNLFTSAYKPPVARVNTGSSPTDLAGSSWNTTRSSGATGNANAAGAI